MSNTCTHLLIDGYNLLHAWPDQGAAWKGGIEVARARLGKNLRPLHDREGIRISVIFDGKGSDFTVEQPFIHPTFSFVFSPSQLSADSVIEQLVANAKDPAGYWVVSRDNGIRETVFALGARCLDPLDLLGWLNLSTHEQDRFLQQERKKRGPRWGQKLFPD